jgi:hypothetical protein
MIIEVTTKDENGNVSFQGKLNSTEVSFVLNVGLNYLMAKGAMPIFSGKEDEDLSVYAPSTATAQ